MKTKIFGFPAWALLGAGAVGLYLYSRAAAGVTLASVTIVPGSTPYLDTAGTARQNVTLVFSDGSTANIAPQVAQLPTIVGLIGKTRAAVTAALS